jgi:predicted glycoside hydrolase/deacetylase ChbG (UPF0249 family)
MVHMADSSRAASLAREHGIPVGLHLNLTTPYTDPDVPPEVAERQAELVRFFAVPRRRWLPTLRRQAAVAACIEDQLAEFVRLHGHMPTHVDGHEHIQCSPSVFLSRSLRPIDSLRLSHTFAPEARPWPKRLARSAVNRAIRARFHTTDRFLSLRDLDPHFGGRGLEPMPNGLTAAVEIMVHPAWPDEQRLLMSAEWAEVLAGRPLGSYQALAAATAAEHRAR